MLRCPVCNEQLNRVDRTLRCEKGHSFDIAKEGYVNLLRAGKSGDLIGDDKYSARSRRDFLNKGYYAALQQELCNIFRDRQGYNAFYYWTLSGFSGSSREIAEKITKYIHAQNLLIIK